MTPNVEIRLFGSFDVLVDGISQPLPIAGATRSLLKYLLCSPDRPVRRDLLIDMFWEGVRFDRKRSALNSAIWRIRKVLAPISGLYLDACTEAVLVRLGDGVWRDVDRLSRALSGADGSDPDPASGNASLARLAECLRASQGCFLDGVDDDWAIIERERIGEMRLRGLTLMMRELAERRRYDEALTYGRQILDADPYREATFREVLCLCVMSGQRARAVRMFESFSLALKSELGIEPMAETVALFEHIKQDLGGGQAPGRPDDPMRRLERQRRLDDRLHRIEADRLELYRSVSAAAN